MLDHIVYDRTYELSSSILISSLVTNDNKISPNILDRLLDALNEQNYVLQKPNQRSTTNDGLDVLIAAASCLDNDDENRRLHQQ